MASLLLKPQRPNVDTLLNPRSARLAAGAEQLLKQFARSSNMKVSPRGAPPAEFDLLASQPVVPPLSKVPRPPQQPATKFENVTLHPLSARDLSPQKPPHHLQMSVGSGAVSPGNNETSTKRAMSPTTALARHGSSMTQHEHDEIRSYSEVYFTGPDARKIRSTPSGNNNGYDDDKGDYRVVRDDHIGYRYQVLSELGRGSFGQVLKAVDHKTKSFVALKIIKNKKKFHDQAAIEVELLVMLKDKDPQGKKHVVRILDHFSFRNHMVITFELHGMNLYELCKQGKFAPLAITTIRQYAKQLLQTLQYLHESRVCHADLKPENILLRSGGSRTQLCVIDFGSSCLEHRRLYTYIQSRFYRAPEVMLGIPYTTAIDMWSLGCILAELANGYPIFPGESELEQMQCIMEYCGVPSKALIERGSRKKHFFDANCLPKLTPNSRGRMRKPGTKDLGHFLKSATMSENSSSSEFADFVARCMCMDPQLRWTPSQAMQHPWIAAAFESSHSQHVPKNNKDGVAAVPSIDLLTGASSAAERVTAGGIVLPLLPHTARRPSKQTT